MATRINQKSAECQGKEQLSSTEKTESLMKYQEK